MAFLARYEYFIVIFHPPRRAFVGKLFPSPHSLRVRDTKQQNLHENWIFFSPLKSSPTRVKEKNLIYGILKAQTAKRAASNI
jgi:hypothetical protein